MLLRHFFLRHPPGEPGEVHGINVGVEDHEIEMPDDNRERREDRLVEVDGARDVEAEFGEESDRGVVEPQDHAGDAHQ